MAEHPINKIECSNLSQKVMMLERMLEDSYPWRITVMVDQDGTGNLVATNTKTGSTKSLYIGVCTVKGGRGK